MKKLRAALHAVPAKFQGRSLMIFTQTRKPMIIKNNGPMINIIRNVFTVGGRNPILSQKPIALIALCLFINIANMPMSIKKIP
jgi:hypothetical protein